MQTNKITQSGSTQPTVEAPWLVQPEQLDEQLWPYCAIRHFPKAGSRLRVSEVQLKKGGKSPVIRHNSSAEFVRILHGEVIIYLDGEQMSGIPGTTIYIPPQVPHGFKAVSESSTILVVHVPGVSPTSDHTVIYEDIDMVPR